MSDVLVLVELDAENHPHHHTAELLALAARIGSPTAVVVGAPGTAAAAQVVLAGWGAATIYAAESADVPHFLITPQVNALAAAAAVWRQ